MEAPDKVFVYCDYDGNPDKVDIYRLGKNSVEYIRKDALLEWAKAEKEKCSIGLSEYDMRMENGKMEILNGLIDKLNSL